MKFTRTDKDTKNGSETVEETVLEIEGTLDAVTAPELRPVVDEIVHERRRLVTLELSGLRLIDSSGVGVIVSLFRRLKETGGQVRIVGLHDQPRAIFRLLRLDKVFTTM
jgi:anti-sigma B factor antagonist